MLLGPLCTALTLSFAFQVSLPSQAAKDTGGKYIYSSTVVNYDFVLCTNLFVLHFMLLLHHYISDGNIIIILLYYINSTTFISQL